jgi:succinate dehydrogenase/fumarate reductase flavoprotein subunit
MHSIPLTESPQKIENNSATVTPVTDTNVIKSGTYKGGGGVNLSYDDENNPTEKPPRTVWTEK